MRPTALPSHWRQRQKPLRPRMTWLLLNRVDTSTAQDIEWPALP
ncbi:TPA: tail fiber assembly protein [Escherichia coli]|nr:tail fiber assembly protein [Escherichia coli]HAZ7388899.1 tail fiber assembly protein [Escherichia coli]